jgi:hypothetical protein
LTAAGRVTSGLGSNVASPSTDGSPLQRRSSRGRNPVHPRRRVQVSLSIAGGRLGCFSDTRAHAPPTVPGHRRSTGTGNGELQWDNAARAPGTNHDVVVSDDEHRRSDRFDGGRYIGGHGPVLPIDSRAGVGLHDITACNHWFPNPAGLGSPRRCAPNPEQKRASVLS